MDDVLAICMAHALERRGEAKILAVMHDAGIPEGKDNFQILALQFKLMLIRTDHSCCVPC